MSSVEIFTFGTYVAIIHTRDGECWSRCLRIHQVHCELDLGSGSISQLPLTLIVTGGSLGILGPQELESTRFMSSKLRNA